jgi:hypothetical protein
MHLQKVTGSLTGFSVKESLTGFSVKESLTDQLMPQQEEFRILIQKQLQADAQEM